MMIFARILLGKEGRVMLCQLLQSLSAPCFGIMMMTPFLQSASTSSPSHTAAKSDYRMVAVSSVSALKSSALRLPCPGAFPFLRDLIALNICFFLWEHCVDVKIISSSGIVSILFRWWFVQNLSEMSVQQSSCFLSPFRRDPCLSLTMVLALAWCFPQMSFVILCTVPCWLHFAACSAPAARPSVYAWLSAPLGVDLSQCQSASLYCC